MGRASELERLRKLTSAQAPAGAARPGRGSPDAALGGARKAQLEQLRKLSAAQTSPTKETRQRRADAREEADDPEQQMLLESADAYREANLMNLAFSALRDHVRMAFAVALFNDQLCRQAFGAWIENAYHFAEERAKMESALIFFRGVTMVSTVMQPPRKVDQRTDSKERTSSSSGGGALWEG